jgi:hypothetical protein
VLAGTFGGTTYFGNLNGIILIGTGGAPTNPTWGGWTIRLLLSDDSYSAAFSFTKSDLSVNPSVSTATNALYVDNGNGALITNFPLTTYYQQLDIAAFDTNNLGFKGIELSAMEANYPDIAYIGVTDAVPEPSTYALLALSAAGLGGYVLRRRRK